MTRLICDFLFVLVASTTHDPKRHLRAGENYSRKHRVNSNRSIVSSNVSSNEDLTSYYEAQQLVVPTFYIEPTTNCDLIEENEITEDLTKNKLSDQ